MHIYERNETVLTDDVLIRSGAAKVSQGEKRLGIGVADAAGHDKKGYVLKWEDGIRMWDIYILEAVSYTCQN